jgi:nitroreductase/NAD-dependent dihydropyrimidine dehydrogenase PreA subunit
MLHFTIDQNVCTQCGLCVEDCPAQIISMADSFPSIAPDKEDSCYKCMHCLAICPGGAVSILGRSPEDSLSLCSHLPSPQQMETLIKGRRSVRRYAEDDLAPELLSRLLEVAWHAPTGVNSRQVCFTVVDRREKMARLRDEVMEGLSNLVRLNALPQGMEFFANFVQTWEESGIDIIFRNAPHLLVVSAPKQVPTPQQDCLIALTYFELFAQANGVGTVWSGLVHWVLDSLLPEIRTRLGVPDDHHIGYSMVFGRPAIQYTRTVQHGPAIIHRAVL